jgi:hypothetical protein
VVNPQTGKPLDEGTLKKHFPREIAVGAAELHARVVVNHRISVRWSSTFRDRPPPCRLIRSGELSDADACEPVG